MPAAAKPFEVAAEGGRGVRVRLLIGHAPIAQIFEPNRLPRHGTADIGAIFEDLELSVEITDFRFLTECEGTFNAIHTLFNASEKTALAPIVLLRWDAPARRCDALALRKRSLRPRRLTGDVCFNVTICKLDVKPCRAFDLRGAPDNMRICVPDERKSSFQHTFMTEGPQELRQ